MMNGYRTLLVWLLRAFGVLMVVGGIGAAVAVVGQLGSHPSENGLDNLASVAGALSTLSVAIGGVSSVAIAEILALSIKRTAGSQ